MAEEIRVKIGFVHNKVEYHSGQIVSEDVAKQFPEFVKTVVVDDLPVQDEKEDEQVVDKESKPAKKKAAKKAAKK